MEDNGLHILVFDGGDARALSQLYILREFMRRVSYESNSDEPVFPYQYFHLIGGAGTGGIIAILLGVLRMNVEEAIESFRHIWRYAFQLDASSCTSDPQVDPTNEFTDRMNSSRLESIVRVLLAERGLKKGQKLLSTCKDDFAKTFVCASPTVNIHRSECFRTYNSPLDAASGILIVQAVRATSAIPGWFLPASVGPRLQKRDYIACDQSLSNPIREAMREAEAIFKGPRYVACILSLGSGEAGPVNVSSALTKGVPYELSPLVSSACKAVDDDFRRLFGGLHIYYRFSVDQGLQSCQDLKDEAFSGRILSYTATYLSQPLVEQDMNRAIHYSKEGTTVVVNNLIRVQTPNKGDSWGLPPITAFFVERSGILNSMYNALFRQDPKSRRVMVVSGMGGCGKTQITSRFIRKHADRFRHILFIDASSESNIRSGLISRVRSFGPLYSRNTVEEALRVLEEGDETISRAWGIVFDNCDNPNIDLASFFPKCDHGFIIVTTRNPSLGFLSPKAHIQIGLMTPQEAIDVLLRSALLEPPISSRDRKHAAAITEKLEYLPVALVQAGSFIKRRQCLDTYLDRLGKHRAKIMKYKAINQLDKHHHSVYATLDVTYPVLSKGSQMFLNILAFTNHSGFPLPLIEQAAQQKFKFEPEKLLDRNGQQFERSVRRLCQIFLPRGEWDELDLEDLVEELEQYSLITRMNVFKLPTLRMHSLVNAWARDRLAEEEPNELPIYHDATLRLLICGTGEDDENIYDLVTPHLSLFEPAWESLHVNDRVGIVNLLLDGRRVERGMRLCERLVSDVMGQSSENTSTSISIARLLLAKTYWMTQDSPLHELAAIREEEAFFFLTEHFFPNEPPLIKAQVQYAQGLCRKDRCEEAELLLRNAHKVLEELQVERQLVLRVIYELAVTCSAPSIKKYQEAKGLFDKVLDEWKDILGKRHWKVVKIKSEVAAFHLRIMEAGEDKHGEAAREATELWIDLVNEANSQRGPQHVYTINAELMKVYTQFLSQDRRLPQTLQGLLEKAKDWYFAPNDNSFETISGVALRAKVCTDEELKRRLVDKFKHYLEPKTDAARREANMLRSFIIFQAEMFSHKTPGRVVQGLVDKMESQGGANQNSLLILRYLLALSYLLVGEYAEGFGAWLELIALRRDALGSDHEETKEAERLLAESQRMAE
ncbi:hypothetical protein CPB86DRAFT_786474 [Serendipita vermifera]|nr:hypothetical protein CPB86DRAFT_786474 [Serendipita vermifera]